jgi:nitrate reductase NapE component
VLFRLCVSVHMFSHVPGGEEGCNSKTHFVCADLCKTFSTSARASQMCMFDVIVNLNLRKICSVKIAGALVILIYGFRSWMFQRVARCGMATLDLLISWFCFFKSLGMQ